MILFIEKKKEYMERLQCKRLFCLLLINTTARVTAVSHRLFIFILFRIIFLWNVFHTNLNKSFKNSFVRREKWIPLYIRECIITLYTEYAISIWPVLEVNNKREREREYIHICANMYAQTEHFKSRI